MRQNNDQDQLKLISTVSNAVTSLNSTNLNSFVLSQQRTAFEVEANSFADLERIIAKLEGEGIYAQIGTSNRSNNFIIGEIIIESFYVSKFLNSTTTNNIYFDVVFTCSNRF